MPPWIDEIHHRVVGGFENGIEQREQRIARHPRRVEIARARHQHGRCSDHGEPADVALLQGEP